jgi:hypothetical protein
MQDYQHRFGELDAATGQYYFSNIRSGLIVGMVSVLALSTASINWQSSPLAPCLAL